MRLFALIFIFFATFASMGMKKIDLRPVATPRPSPMAVADPYFGFGPPSKNPADYESESSPLSYYRRRGVPTQYMSASPTQVGNMQSQSGLQSYNSGQIYGGGANAPSPGVQAPIIAAPSAPMISSPSLPTFH